jgi:DNA-binding CsgD family transcriptional regulator
MAHLVFLYNFICYSFSFASFLFAIVTASVKKPATEWQYVLFNGSFLLLFIPGLISSYLQAAQVAAPPILERVFSFTLILGLSLLIYAVPVFVRATIHRNTSFALKLLFICLGGIPGFFTLVFLDTGYEPVFRYSLYAGLILAVAYSTIYGNYMSFAHRHAASRSVTPKRWGRIFKGVSIATVIFLPMTVVFDLFPQILGDNSPLASLEFRAYPLYYFVWNLLYAIYTIPLYKKETECELPEIADPGLSKRELEIARLLTQGLSYKDIADRLHISLSTAKTHIIRIYRKTGTSNKIGLLRFLSPESGRS